MTRPGVPARGSLEARRSGSRSPPSRRHNYRVTLRNGVLVYVERQADGEAQLTLSLSKARLIALLSGERGPTPAASWACSSSCCRSSRRVIRASTSCFREGSGPHWVSTMLATRPVVLLTGVPSRHPTTLPR
ncbi:alkyl sulfatase C-terminal domain-containing protein [Sorangium sp. So ce590]|uniref:alkyl sulfatase C-terminal domain-containing protein n=1 Tax=Sorangium sp. So ce590 TaxID=3133317 RepID=UPI003F62843C